MITVNDVIFDEKYYSGDNYSAVMNFARITPGKTKSKYVDIAGGNSSIDLTEAVGGVVFEDGVISFKFTLFSFDKKEQMKQDIHGKRMKIVLAREDGFYFDGRINCEKEEFNEGVFELYFTATVKPYKYENLVTRHEEEVESKTKEIILVNSRMPVMPTITVEGTVYLTYENMKYTIKSGTYHIPEITLYEGKNRIKLSGKGKILFEYRKGRLI